MKRVTTLILSVTAATALLAAQPGKVDARRGNQQDRIAQGVKSGALTPRETANLERKEVAINHEIRTDRALNGGKLTPRERQIVNHQQNQMSRQIYKAKH